MKLIRAMATVGGLTAVSRVLGFVRDILTAVVLGAGPLADAFFVALKLPNFFRRVTAEGAFSVSFVPLYSELLEKEGKESADRFAGNAMVLMFWILLGFTLVVMTFMPAVITVIAPGFVGDSVRFDMAVNLCRITFPYLLMMSIAALLGGVLNAHGRFAPFAAAPILFNLSLIALMLVAWWFPSAAHALAWGVMLAGVVQFIFLYIVIRREGIHIPLRFKVDDRVKKLFRLMGPGVLGAGVMQINLFADMIMGSFLPTGSISYLYYGDRLNQLPLSTVGIAVGTALLPMLSRASGSGDIAEARNLFNRALEVTLFLGVPAAVGLLVLARPIMDVLFRHGAFSAADAQMTALVLQGYVIGLPGYIAVKVFSTAFFSKQDTKTPVKIAIIAALANVAMSLIFIQFIGVAGIALSTGIVGWLYVYLLWRPLRGNPVAEIDERLKRTGPKIVISACVMAVVVGVLAWVMGPMMDGPKVMRMVALGVLVGAGMASYGAAIMATGAMRVSEVRGYFRRA